MPKVRRFVADGFRQRLPLIQRTTNPDERVQWSRNLANIGYHAVIAAIIEDIRDLQNELQQFDALQTNSRSVSTLRTGQPICARRQKAAIIRYTPKVLRPV